MFVISDIIMLYCRAYIIFWCQVLLCILHDIGLSICALPFPAAPYYRAGCKTLFVCINHVQFHAAYFALLRFTFFAVWACTDLLSCWCYYILLYFQGSCDFRLDSVSVFALHSSRYRPVCLCLSFSRRAVLSCRM